MDNSGCYVYRKRVSHQIPGIDYDSKQFNRNDIKRLLDLTKEIMLKPCNRDAKKELAYIGLSLIDLLVKR